MMYVLIAVGTVFGLAVLGMLQAIVDATRRLAACALASERRAIERYARELSERATDNHRADLLTQAQQRIAQAQVDVAAQQKVSLADQQAYRDEQRQHMATCARRYEALLAGESAPGDVPVKH